MRPCGGVKLENYEFYEKNCPQYKNLITHEKDLPLIADNPACETESHTMMDCVIAAWQKKVMNDKSLPELVHKNKVPICIV